MKSGWLRYRSAMVRVLALAAVIGVAVLCLRLLALSPRDLTPERVKGFVQGFGILAPLVFILLYAMRAVVLVIPVGIMSIAGGLVFGKGLGFAYIMVGATLGSCLSFLVARYFGRAFIERFQWLHKGRIKTFDEKIERNGLAMILFIRLVPLFQYDAVNFGSGLSKMRFRDYALGSFLGMMPGGFVNALLGSSIVNPRSVEFWIAVAAYLLLMSVPLVYRGVRRRSRTRVERRTEDVASLLREEGPG